MIARAWTFDDVELLFGLEQRIFKDPWSIYAIAESLSHELFHGVIFEDDGEVIGYYGFYSIPPEAHIANIAVVPEKQGKGYGKAMLSHLLKTAEDLGDTDVTLEVRPSNEVAIKLYERYGFKTEGRRKRYYGDGEDALIMWRRTPTTL